MKNPITVRNTRRPIDGFVVVTELSFASFRNSVTDISSSLASELERRTCSPTVPTRSSNETPDLGSRVDDNNAPSTADSFSFGKRTGPCEVAISNPNPGMRADGWRVLQRDGAPGPV